MFRKKIAYFQGANPAIARKQVSELSEQFQAALVSYDEGLSDDKLLAAAIWRRFYSLSPDTKAENIERIVHFVRHQVSKQIYDRFAQFYEPLPLVLKLLYAIC